MNGQEKVESNLQSRSWLQVEVVIRDWLRIELRMRCTGIVTCINSIYIFILFFLLLTKPQANTWPQKPDIISFYGIRVEFVPQQQQSKHVCHNHMWRLTDFPITNVCTWLWTSVSVCVWGVYLHTQTSICVGSRFVFVFVVALSIFGFCITTCDFLRFLHCDCQKQWQTVSAKLRFTSNEVGPIRFCTLCGCAILGSWFDFSFNFNSLFFFLWLAMHFDELNWKQ